MRWNLGNQVPHFTLIELIARYSAQITDRWFTTFQASIYPILNSIPRKTNVRVGILDTGINATHPELQQALKDNKFKSLRGFPETLDPLLDLHGRGTHAVSVLMRIAPSVELIIARVVDDAGILLGEENDYISTTKVPSNHTLLRHFAKVSGN